MQYRVALWRKYHDFVANLAGLLFILMAVQKIGHLANMDGACKVGLYIIHFKHSTKEALFNYCLLCLFVIVLSISEYDWCYVCLDVKNIFKLFNSCSCSASLNESQSYQGENAWSMDNFKSAGMESYVYLLPLSVFVLFPTTFIITYCISVLLGHITPEFPYISDTGTYSPESCIFAQSLNIASFLLALTFYVRFRQIKELHITHPSGSMLTRMNKISLAIGILSCFGVSLVANFQETNMVHVHLTGALMAFGGGTLYFWFQTLCSYQMHPAVIPIKYAHIRLLLTSIATVSFIMGMVAAPLSHINFHGQDPTKWYPSDGGWTYHVIATAAEWTCAICFDLLTLSFVNEFKFISFGHPPIFITIDPFTSEECVLESSDAASIRTENS